MTKITDQGVLKPQINIDARDNALGRGDSGRDIDNDSREFESMMKDGHKERSDKAGTRETRKKKDQGEHPGDGILQSFQSRVLSDTSGQVDGAESTSPISDIAHEIANKILVSDPSQSGKDEVRIMLKESTLAGTEVRIAKDDGMIKVDLLTSSNDAHRVLMDHHGDLQNILKEKVSESVSVTVQFSSMAGDQNDGRSREQRNLFEEMLEKK